MKDHIKDSIPKLLLPLETYQKIMSYALATENEIGGFADVVWDKETRKLIAGDVYLPNQEVTYGTVEFSEEEFSRFMGTLIKKGHTQLPQLWWHSHGDMSTFFSGTDQDTIEWLENSSFIVALCVNRKQKMHASLTIFNPIRLQIEPLEIEVGSLKVEVTKTVKDEVNKKITEKKWGYGKNYNDWWGDEWRKDNGVYRLPNPAGKGQINMFPRSTKKKHKLIRRKGLYLAWDNKRDDYVYKDKHDNIWLDPDLRRKEFSDL